MIHITILMTESKKEIATPQSLITLFSDRVIKKSWDSIRPSKITSRKLSDFWYAVEDKGWGLDESISTPYFCDGILHLFNTRCRLLGVANTGSGISVDWNEATPKNIRIYDYGSQYDEFCGAWNQDPPEPIGEMVILTLWEKPKPSPLRILFEFDE